MSEKTALITGASGGIGEAAALRFAEGGIKNLILTGYKNNKRLAGLAQQLEAEYGCSCYTFLGDLGDYNSVVTLFGQIEDRFGGLDILINNAGISYIGLLTDMEPEDWNRIISTNLTSVFHCCKLAVPYMVKKKSGKIISVSSVWGVCGASCEAAYSASKGGLNAFTKALAKELAPSNIQVNAIACGAFDTSMNSFLDEADKQALIEEIPACRMGAPHEAAELLYDLAFNHTYLTGQIIQLDGGWI